MFVYQCSEILRESIPMELSNYSVSSPDIRGPKRQEAFSDPAGTSGVRDEQKTKPEDPIHTFLKSESTGVQKVRKKRRKGSPVRALNHTNARGIPLICLIVICYRCSSFV